MKEELRQDSFFEEIKKILSAAEKEGVTLRLLGATAIRTHSETARRMAADRPLTDLDFVACRKDSAKIGTLFADLGYQPSQTFNMIHGDERLMFFGRDGDLKIDVWLELFRMAHTLNFKDRLDLDNPTLPLSDLLMTKLQIVELNEKDARDIVSLLIDHDLSQNDCDRERINVSRLVDSCNKDWGIYKTFTMNLGKIKQLAPKYVSDVNATQTVLERIDRIVEFIEAGPKTLAWRMRAKVGERKRWYETPDVR
jgi:hypothetical protein